MRSHVPKGEEQKGVAVPPVATKMRENLRLFCDGTRFTYNYENSYPERDDIHRQKKE
jgi:hypothetical protein